MLTCIMDPLPLLESGNPAWDRWPPESTIGNCKVTVYHSDDPKHRALALMAEPIKGEKNLGAMIFCFLPATKRRNIEVRPSISAYWSSRRAGPHTSKYFSGPYPKLEVALLHALESGAKKERAIASLYLLLSSFRGEVSLEKEDGLHRLANDKQRFEKVARDWLSRRHLVEDGIKRLNSARKIVSGSKKWYTSLGEFEALRSPLESNSGSATATQSAVYLAILIAIQNANGVPLLLQVRSAFHEIAIKFEQDSKATQEARTSPKAPKLNLSGFDTAAKNLGFSWLPQSWDQSMESDLSE